MDVCSMFDSRDETDSSDESDPSEESDSSDEADSSDECDSSEESDSADKSKTGYKRIKSKHPRSTYYVEGMKEITCNLFILQL